MSSDPLLLPEIWSDLPKGGAAESARSDFVANGRSGLVLIDYAGGRVPSDSPPVVLPLDRAGPPLQADGLGPASALLAKGLSDLTAIVTQAEALLRAQGTLKGDVHFAVERIHDVALALRMRDVNSALCDMLEASVREVGDAVVRHEAAATGAMSAAALLGDIMHRIEELMRMLAVRAEADTGPSTPDATSRVDAGFAIGPSAPGAKVFVAALASVAFEAQPVDDVPLPVAGEVEHPLEAPAAADASQASAAIDPLPAAATGASVGGAEGRATAFAAGPLTYSAPLPITDPPLTAAVDRLAPDGAAVEDPVFAGTMSARTISNDVTSEGATSDGLMSADVVAADATFGDVVAAGAVAADAMSEGGAASDDGVSDTTITDAGDARVFLDALSDGSAIGNETLREPKPLGEADAAIPAEQAAAVATHLQNEINVPAEIPAETVAAEIAAAETIAAELVGAETVPAEAVAAEAVAATESVADPVAAGPADDQDQPIAAPPVGEATAAALPAAAAESDANQLPLSAFEGKGVTAAQTMIRRPTSDPLAAFYGLSEEELIALFS